ncbi:Clustered mitochondria protein [Dendrobium catenatum]|uniref:Clustered mitochondria protein n=1 Tax=Dendrobium catenatum TaxID=906689 RepID=A0A2I0XIR9_9ASPA|nr:Clustered mitochondria protein [Dendrobium catenatum]
MAPKAGKAKPHKAKGEKKKKEEKVLPTIVDITVQAPDFSHLTLKNSRCAKASGRTRGRLPCDLLLPRSRGKMTTNSLPEKINYESHAVGMTEEEYTEELAVAHIRRLLDIIACTTAFSHAPAKNAGASTHPDANSPTSGAPSSGGVSKERDALPADTSESILKTQRGSDKSGSLAPAVGASGANKKEEAPIYPPPKLGNFYSFFSFSHITPPLQYIRRSVRPFVDDKRVDDFFQIDVRFCNGKLVTIVACRNGFYPAGKRALTSHSLVGLLLQISRSFDGKDLILKNYPFQSFQVLSRHSVELELHYIRCIKLCLDRTGRFGNLPYGFRANTWVVPPVVADSPAVFPLLPTEDETWGGSGGGQGRDGKQDHRKWAREFSILVSMPCKTAEERQIRDRKAFLLHSLFTDVAVLKAVGSIQDLVFGHKHSNEMQNDPDAILHEEQIGDMNITVRRDAADASAKLDVKFDGSQTSGMSSKEVAIRNLLKGITADESVIVHDTATLGVVVVRHCGYTAVVEVPVEPGTRTQQDFVIADQPEGGSNALNVNSLRMQLHKSSAQLSNGALCSQFSENGSSQSSRSLVRKLLSISLAKLEKDDQSHRKSIRWELGQCWVQHLQQDTGKSQPKNSEVTKVEPTIKGLGKQLKEIKKKLEERAGIIDPSKDGFVDASKHQMLDDCIQQEQEGILMKLLPEAAFLRLKESNTGLHVKVELADKLSHVRSLCMHEMVVRAFKHMLQAVVAAVSDVDDLAASIASCLNVLLGTLPSEDVDPNIASDHHLKQKWIEIFLYKRFGWRWKEESWKDLRKFSLLRSLCHKATIYQQKALDINERELGLDHPDTMKSYGDLAVFYYRLQHTELALKYVNRALYLLHLTCGPSHPNTAATYINVAMMEEGLGNVHVALRYLHEALKCNQRLLGADHIQTAASYHAIAIALSLMEAYTLSVQHEQTTLRILQTKLGAEDLRTQDAAAWLEYFESKVQEQQDAARNGTPKADASIASKGHLSVSDLLDYINPDEELKLREIQKKQARIKIKGRLGQSQWETVEDEDIKEEKKKIDYPPKKISSDKENNALSQPMESKDEKLNISIAPITSSPRDDSEQGETCEEGWQEAVPKGRNFSNRKPSSSRRPSLARLNTNAINNGETGRYRGKVVSNFPSPRTSPNETSPTNALSPFSDKIVKTSSFGFKPATASIASKTVPLTISTNVQSTRKNLSYKEVALASPGTIMKSAEQKSSRDEDHNEQNGEARREVTNVELLPNGMQTEEDKIIHSAIEKDSTPPTASETKSNKIHEQGVPEEIDIAKMKSFTVEDSQFTCPDMMESMKFDGSSDSRMTSFETELSNEIGNDTENCKAGHNVLEELELSIANKDSAEKENEGALAARYEPPYSDRNVPASADNAAEQGDDSSDLSSGGENEKATPMEGETNQQTKETSKKLSASAPPFNPSTIPVFGSASIPNIQEHGGILPPPVIMPPILSSNPIRKHPHQSATTRIPYGPRLAGGFNRAGHRGARNKLTIPNIEPIAVDGTGFSPKIMNPDAAEFIPGQPWLPNGYPTSVYGLPVSPQESSVSSGSLAASPTVTADVSENNEALPEGNDHSSHTSIKESEKAGEGKEGDKVEPEINAEAKDTVPEGTTVEVESSESAIVEKSVKCWADYSDSEAEEVEILI